LGKQELAQVFFERRLLMVERGVSDARSPVDRAPNNASISKDLIAYPLYQHAAFPPLAPW
jgi:hypothetical protein